MLSAIRNILHHRFCLALALAVLLVLFLAALHRLPSVYARTVHPTVVTPVPVPTHIPLALPYQSRETLLRHQILRSLWAKREAGQERWTVYLPAMRNDTPSPLPQPTPDNIARTARVPILMYHYLSPPPSDADRYRLDLSVPPAEFARHLDRLQAEDYTIISLTDLVFHLTQGAPLPEKSVIITFDDGYRDNYTNAFPLLVERGMTATFFVITDFIDEERPAYLTWDMVREMHAAGMSIESHGRNHASLAGQDDDYLVWQALGSQETIEHELGVRPHFVSYPAGEYDENTARIFQSAHYWAGATTQQGATHSSDALFQLQRIRVRGTTDADELIRLLELDW